MKLFLKCNILRLTEFIHQCHLNQSDELTISELIAQECSHRLCRLIYMFICSPNNILLWTRSNWIYRILNVIYIYDKFCVISYSFGGSLYLSSKCSLGFKLHLPMQSCARHQGRFACYMQLMTFHEVNSRIVNIMFHGLSILVFTEIESH